MKITILGTGMVGQTVASKLFKLGHIVTMGTRNPEETKQRTQANQITGESFSDWFKKQEGIKLTNLEESALEADFVINATSGQASIDVLKKVGEANLSGKVLLDIANPLDFSQGMPPSLFVSNTDSLGEQIQKEFPELKVVKSLNTMNMLIMMNPESIPGNHNVFVSGNDANAKEKVSGLLKSIGWKQENIIDLGDITTARGTEMLLPIWLRLWTALGHANFNFHIQQSK
ncbi:NAD(P)-binding domain-containing protein [Fulvivirga sp. 29W222]|uniref:NAD(P)-binding domain-containing protein n=1 Tax=Fulvivirga marina TaxID=2494733 RepID=A0A937G082_9BACT|nr:NAD(P)-binding domain-containing protein [Fulvivirga marina]MBL6448252.1 NAD(P)-binding domain-containing protein [Fulvivirga marina]